jgi:hypothetical protein
MGKILTVLVCTILITGVVNSRELKDHAFKNPTTLEFIMKSGDTHIAYINDVGQCILGKEDRPSTPGQGSIEIRIPLEDSYQRYRVTLEPVSQGEIVMARAREVVVALRDKDMNTLSRIVHPEKGCRFSPYAWASDNDLLFTGKQVVYLMEEQTIRRWGYYDGSGRPIDCNFSDYFKIFVYDRDFANAEQMAYNKILEQGNTRINIAEYYPGADFVEFHFSGFEPKYGGMDWRSLRLVFQEKDGEWYLVGIIHDQWTI